jgi:hypothetical protein
MKRLYAITMPVLLIAAALTVQAKTNPSALVVTATNADNNQLLVYNTSGKLLQTLSTQGKGGVGGNAGGVTARGGMVAVVNFGSKTVSIFQRLGSGLHMTQSISTASSPVSVAFGNNHLYILGTTNVESHQLFGPLVHSNPDGVVTLYKADGSAAQVGAMAGQLIISEKSNIIETVNLLDDGAVAGTASLVQNIPANVDTPFGLVTRGNNAYVTIAHADEISLVRDGKVLTTTPSVTQHAPCWVALDGPFLFSANSPSMSVSRYAVYGQKIVQDAAVAASFNGSPTDIDARFGLAAVIDGSGTMSHLTVFSVDEDGNLTSQGVATVSAKINGVAIVE